MTPSQVTSNQDDILDAISDRCDPDEIIERLNLSSSDLCELLREVILDYLGNFEDILEEGEDGE